MNSVTFAKELAGVQDELLRFAYKLTTDHDEAHDLRQETSLKALDNEDKYEPDTNFMGWTYTIMRNIFINNYRRNVREQTFVDTTDNHRGCLRPERNVPHGERPAQGIPYALPDAFLGFQVPRNCRKDGPAHRDSEEPHLLHTATAAAGTEGFPLN